jgi:hypothetical protein
LRADFRALASVDGVFSFFSELLLIFFEEKKSYLLMPR